MRASAFDRRVTVEQRAVSQDATFGSEVVTWSAFASNLPAQVLESSTSGEFARGAAATYARPIRVRVRYLSGLDPGMRINYGGRLLKITGLAEVGRRDMIEFSCSEWDHE